MTLLKIEDLQIIENIADIKLEKSNFRYAFYLLEKEKRIALSNFYMFCSYLDNIVDSVGIDLSEKQSRINGWRNLIIEMYKGNNRKLVSLWEVFNKYSVPLELVLDLVDGIGKDLSCSRYNTFEDLLSYCYGVASIVGLICMYIFTNNKLNSDLEQYAINLGYALQLTNIIRDIGEDFGRNYVYIPNSLLVRFNYSEEDIKNHIYNDNFYNLMTYLYERAIYYYLEADYYIKDIRSNIVNSDIIKVSEAIKNIYFKLLQKIKRNNFHIYDKKIRISNIDKIICILFTK